jgi:hypothetical protein
VSLHIESLDELRELLKKLNLKVSSVHELRALLLTVNATYNPVAARTRAARLIGVVTPCIALGVGGLVSLLMVTGALKPSGGEVPERMSLVVIGVAVVLGIAALVSTVAVVGSLLFLYRRQGAGRADAVVPPLSPFVEAPGQESAPGPVEAGPVPDERLMTAIQE